MGATSEEKRVALVIGNGRYVNAPPLDNPVNDSTAVASKLAGLGFTVISGEDLDYAAFAGRVRDFGRALKTAHAALFFYAGHGLQVRGENYVVPVDASLEDEADVGLELISVQTVMSQMETDGRTSVVILDACRNNPLARNLRRAMGTRAAAIGEGLGRVEAGIGSFIAFATTRSRNGAADTIRFLGSFTSKETYFPGRYEPSRSRRSRASNSRSRLAKNAAAPGFFRFPLTASLAAL
jgi:uncharacterized caspase-like protein